MDLAGIRVVTDPRVPPGVIVVATRGQLVIWPGLATLTVRPDGRIIVKPGRGPVADTADDAAAEEPEFDLSTRAGKLASGP